MNKKQITTYQLYNLSGCFFAETETTSMRRARQFFAKKFTGKFTLYNISTGDCKKIILK